MSLEQRIHRVLTLNGVAPAEAIKFVCGLVVAHHDNIEGKRLLAIRD